MKFLGNLFNSVLQAFQGGGFGQLLQMLLGEFLNFVTKPKNDPVRQQGETNLGRVMNQVSAEDNHLSPAAEARSLASL